MDQPYFLGVDIGTSESKGVLMTANAEIVATCACPHGMESPKPGYAEHDAESVWWADFCDIVQALPKIAHIATSQIAAVAVSTIAPCCLPVDKDLRPLRKAILYGVDVRAAEEITFLENYYGKEAIIKLCGSPVSSQSAAAKILWIKNNEPEVYAAADKFLTGASYLTAKLTGQYVIDRYTAATWVPLYDVLGEDWVEDTSLFCRRDQLAQCRWSDEVVGTIHEKAARETGLAQGTPVLCGTADASAEAVSAGVLDAGDLLLMYGSSFFFIHIVDTWTRDERLCSGPYLFPGTYAVTAGMSTTGTLTRWFRDQFARDLDKSSAYEQLAASVQNIPLGSGGIIVLPYLSGERTPINDPKAKGVIFGLNLTHTREYVYNACLEGVGYGVAQHLDIFKENHMDTRKIMAVGGGTKNVKWLKIVSDICGVDQLTVKVGIGAAYGDAMLAALGTGYFKNVGEIAAKVKVKDRIPPNPEHTARYIPCRGRYKALYEATKQLMHEDVDE